MGDTQIISQVLSTWQQMLYSFTNWGATPLRGGRQTGLPRLWPRVGVERLFNQWIRVWLAVQPFFQVWQAGFTFRSALVLLALHERLLRHMPDGQHRESASQIERIGGQDTCCQKSREETYAGAATSPS